MTPEERADKILAAIFGIHEHGSGIVCPDQVLIADQIRKAEQEAVKTLTGKPLSVRDYEHGFTDAINKAADILEKEHYDGPVPLSHLGKLEKQIRSLKPYELDGGVKIKTDPSLKPGEWRLENEEQK